MFQVNVPLTQRQMHDRNQHFVHEEVWYMLGSVAEGCTDGVNNVRVHVVWEEIIIICMLNEDVILMIIERP